MSRAFTQGIDKKGILPASRPCSTGAGAFLQGSPAAFQGKPQ
ncbi:hypothetical protein C4J85_0954 [Pseudomonas sp. R4-34-07]|nr:hypothetical protein C4J85_0954 [Pseudomonas sp. R4-34-07]